MPQSLYCWQSAATRSPRPAAGRFAYVCRSARAVKRLRGRAARRLSRVVRADVSDLRVFNAAKWCRTRFVRGRRGARVAESQP
jgi:hypothetical protein